MTLQHSVGYTTASGVTSMAADPLLSPAEQERRQVYLEAVQDTEQRGYLPGSIVRICPWSLSLDGAAHRGKRLVGVPVERDMWDTASPRLTLASGLSIPYVHDVITTPFISAGTRFRGTSKHDAYAEVKPSVDLPIGLASDAVRQQNMLNTQGGIFGYEGHQLPQDVNGKWFEPRGGFACVGWNEFVSLPQAAEQAFVRMVAHMKDVASSATDAHRTGDKVALREVRGNRKNQCVQYLLNIGVLTDPPAWFLEHGGAATGAKHTKCPMCPRRVENGTVRCQCGYIVDPFTGYGKIYDEASDGGLLTARRMTKEQLKTLGLYPRIKPLAEHLADKTKEAEKK